MITLREVVASLYGTWRLIALDRGAVGYFDATPAGFWRSFYAAVLAAPCDVAIVLLARGEPPTGDALHFWLGLLVSYVLSWLVWPWLAVYLARALDRSDALFVYLTAHNWAQVAASLFSLIVLILTLGFFPEQAVLASMLTFFVVLAYEGFIASAALRIDRMKAVGVASAYFAVTYVMIRVMGSLIT